MRAALLVVFLGCSNGPIATDAAVDVAPQDAGVCTTCNGGTACVQLESDPENCGGCGHVCSSGSCVAGACSYQTVFVTSTSHDGAFGGLDAADTTCNDLAAKAGRKGSYMAWLSTGGNSPSTRFRLKSTRPYRLVDGVTTVATNWTDLTDGTLAAPIDMDELGGKCAYANVSTDTKPDGTQYAPDADCSGWTAGVTGPAPMIGQCSGTDVDWTQFTRGTCTMVQRFYCFEQ